jgi:hypothetical protein
MLPTRPITRQGQRCDLKLWQLPDNLRRELIEKGHVNPRSNTNYDLLWKEIDGDYHLLIVQEHFTHISALASALTPSGECNSEVQEIKRWIDGPTKNSTTEDIP